MKRKPISPQAGVIAVLVPGGLLCLAAIFFANLRGIDWINNYIAGGYAVMAIAFTTIPVAIFTYHHLKRNCSCERRNSWW